MSRDHEDRCPICRTKWKVTKFGANVWKDCLTCGDKAENLIAKAKEEAPSHKYEGADWLQQEAWPQDYGMPVIEEDDDWDDEIPFIKIKINGKEKKILFDDMVDGLASDLTKERFK